MTDSRDYSKDSNKEHYDLVAKTQSHS